MVQLLSRIRTMRKWALTEVNVSDYRRKGYGAVRLRHVGMVLIYGLILVGIVVGGLIWDRQGDEETETFGSLTGRFESDISLAYQGKTVHYREYEITNYLLIGMDREQFADAGYQDGGQADFLLVLSVDRRNRTITPVMIDRDTMTPVTTYGIFGNPAGTRTMQICLAQAFSGVDTSGAENTAQAVSVLLGGVKIDRCLLMNLGGIALLNDSIGGVEVTLEDDLTVLDPALEKGKTVLLTGDLAEHFVRGRRTVADGTNASRMIRQQTYIEALIRKMNELLESDQDFLNTVFDSLNGHMETDTEEKILISEANTYSKYDWQPLRTLPGDHIIGADGFAEFHTDETAMMDMIVEVWFQK